MRKIGTPRLHQIYFERERTSDLDLKQRPHLISSVNWNFLHDFSIFVIY